MACLVLYQVRFIIFHFQLSKVEYIGDWMFYKASKNQTRFFLFEKATGTKPVLPTTYLIEGDLDKDKLKGVLKVVVKNREMLRARLVQDKQGNIVNEIKDNDNFLEERDISGLDTDSQKVALVNLLQEEIDKHDGFFRTLLVTLSPAKFSLTLIPHHGVVDGLSIGNILADLSFEYNQTQKHTTDDSEQYKNTIDRLEKIEVESKEKDTEYWKNTLINCEQQTAIPAAVGTSDQQFSKTEYISETYQEVFHSNVRNIAKKLKCRTFSIYLALGLVVLQRLTGQIDILATFQSAGRRNHNVDPNLIGLFSKALIVRSPQENDLVSDLIINVDKQVSDALSHEDVSFQSVLQHTNTKVRFAFNWYPIYDQLTFDGCKCTEEILIPWPTDFDINFHFINKQNSIDIRAYYNSKSCTYEVVKASLQLFRALLEGVPNKIDDPISNLVSIGVREVNELPPLNTIDKKRIDEVFFSQAENEPHRTAFTHEGAQLNYSDLSGLVIGFSQILENSNSGSSTPRIAIMGHRGLGIVVGALSALRLKGSFCLIDPCYPADRILTMLDCIDPDYILVADNLIVPIPEFSDFIQVEHDSSYSIQHIFQNKIPNIERVDEGVAYWLFTSGSTGQPKVISSDHSPLLHALKWQRETFKINSDDRVSFLSGVSHDPALRDIFLPLLIGGSVSSPDPSRIFEPGYLFSWINDCDISVIHLTPAMVSLIEMGIKLDEYCSSVKQIFIGGDRVSLPVINQIRNIAPSANIVNVYGSSETPQIVLFKDISTGSIDLVSPIPVGRPRTDVVVTIEDTRRRLCGVLEPGEVVIKTHYLSNGYLNMIDDSINPFDNSFGSDKYDTYRTGDVGYLNTEGDIVLIGRIDDQVKIRGYRVEPAEVTYHLQKIVESSAAIVVSLPLESGEYRLFGYVEKKEPIKDRKKILAEMARGLPPYMVPDTITFVDQLPYLPNGKINRHQLPSPDFSKRDEYVAPRTPREQQLADIWSKALGVTPIGVTDSFFDLGGDSLTGISLMLEMERAGIDADVTRTIMDGTTIEEIAKSEIRGENLKEADKNIDISMPYLHRMAFHCLRGILVILIVIGHWAPGAFERLSDLKPLHTYMTPIFNLGTPGFAIMFGATLSYFNFELFKTRYEIHSRQIKQGLILLSITMVVMSFLSVIKKATNDIPIGITEIVGSYYNVIGFYFLALASVPLWFRWIRLTKESYSGLAFLFILYAVFDIIAREILLPYEWSGISQLLRLYATAKFSYFNMTLGVILGLFLGFVIYRHPSLPFTPKFIALGCGLITLSMAIAYQQGEISELLSPSRRLDLWKWGFYYGFIICLISIFWKITSKFGSRGGLIEHGLKILSSIGVLALFFFVFHALVFKIKGILDVYGVPDLIGLIIVLSLFFGIGGLLVQKIRKVYYG